MKKIAITGNIGSGKSTLAKYLTQQGYQIIHTDKLGHDLLMINSPCYQDIVKLSQQYNYNILNEDNSISRTKLGKYVFEDRDFKQSFDEIVHPLIHKQTAELIKISQNNNEKVVFIEIPLVYENKREKDYDEIWLVYCEDSIRKKRLKKRHPNWTEETISQRIKSQIPQEEKIKSAHHIIDNSYDLDQTYLQLEKLLSNFNTVK